MTGALTRSMELPSRLPLHDRRRRIAPDAKLSFREELLAERAGESKRLCRCNIFLGENRAMRLRTVVQEHLKVYGRHPYHRGSTEV